MKRFIMLIMVCILLFSGCQAVPEAEGTTAVTHPGSVQPEEKEVFRGAWISYIELRRLDRSEKEYAEYIESLFMNMKQVGTTDVFVHVRAFSDALYPSELFPYAEYMGNGEETDVLSLAVDMGEKYGMGIHPWINPYRAFYSSDSASNVDGRLARLIKENDGALVEVAGKHYLNPASDEVRALIIEGAEEILTKYPTVEGIHIDDYFYPEGFGNADSEDYEDYLMSGGKLSLESWRRENVSTLVSSLYSVVKSFGEDRIFSISPCGSIEKNVNTLFADVPVWASGKGYCDMLIPQIYFGFENESQPFCQTLDSWKELTQGSEVKIVAGLALYKCGLEDIYAGTGRDEWINNGDIISRQIQYVNEKGLEGYSLYSASFVNFSESFLSKELDMIKNMI